MFYLAAEEAEVGRVVSAERGGDVLQEMYYELSKQLIDLLASGRRDIARQYINKILVIWHNNKRVR